MDNENANAETRIYVYAEHCARAGEVVVGDVEADDDGVPTSYDYVLFAEGTDDEIVETALRRLMDYGQVMTQRILHARRCARNVARYVTGCEYLSRDDRWGSDEDVTYPTIEDAVGAAMETFGMDDEDAREFVFASNMI